MFCYDRRRPLEPVLPSTLLLEVALLEGDYWLGSSRSFPAVGRNSCRRSRLHSGRESGFCQVHPRDQRDSRVDMDGRRSPRSNVTPSQRELVGILSTGNSG